MDTTIIYYTDNQLDSFLFEKCQEKLLEAADGKRIVTVSQKPIDFGDNICVGDIGRSHHSLFYQALEGAKAANTKYIALAEHDCLYTKEHFNWTPPDSEYFYYNINHWLVQWGGEHTGMYSYFKRKVLSNLICDRELFIEAIEEKLLMIEKGSEIRKGQAGACEPGVCDNRKAFIKAKAALKDVGKDSKNYRAKPFSTSIPNLDIRHGGNFSGGRRAKKRRFSVEPWGSFHVVMGVAPPEKWYQESVIDGVVMPTRRNNDTNEKRWNTFIRPHIKLSAGFVTDLGCNAGFYCRKMTELGFTATGVERDHRFLRHAHYWEGRDPRGVRVVESDINNYTPTCSHYVLLANVHYWIDPENLAILVNKLRKNALNVILIGRYRPYKGHQSPADLSFLEQLFSGWVKGDVIKGKKHFSVMFTNPDLIAKNIDDVFHHQQLFKSKKFLPSYNLLIDDVLAGKEINKQETDYWNYFVWRRFRNKEKLMDRHINLIHSMVERGINEPLTIGHTVDGEYKPNRLYDGDHRLIVAKKLGHKSLIFKVNQEQRGTK